MASHMATHMANRLRPLILVALLAAALPAAAQEAGGEGTAPPAPPGLSTGEPVAPKPGQSYLRGKEGDWDIRCIKAESGPERCQLYQLLRDEAGNAVAEFTVFDLPDNGQIVAGATVVTPLETLLTQGLTLAVDGGQAKRYPFTFCNRIGCYVRIGLTKDDLDAYRRGSVANVQIAPAAAPTQAVTLSVSLKGFTKGFEAVALPAAVTGLEGLAGGN